MGSLSLAQNSKAAGPRALNWIQPGVPLPTFTRSCRKHQGTHWGPAHSKQVLVGQLQGGQGLGLQHGVQVDVAIGPCAQEEVPGGDAGQKARQADECRVSGTAGPSCQTSRLSGSWKASPDPQTWGPQERGPATRVLEPELQRRNLGPDQTAGPWSSYRVRPSGAPSPSLCQGPCGGRGRTTPAGPSLPVEGGAAHRVDRTTMGGEGELCRSPQGHRAGHPRESGLFRCQGALEREAAFRAQNKKAGVEAGESHRRGSYLGLPAVRLRRNGRPS